MSNQKQPLVLKKTLTLSTYNYFRTHLKMLAIIFPSLQMTDGETNVLAGFMEIEDKVLYGFSTEARQVVKNKLGLGAAGLSNYLRQLKDKKLIVNVIVDNKVKLVIRKELYPNKDKQAYLFKLSNNDQEIISNEK